MARPGSSAPKMADTTATPSTPLPASFKILPALMPPMATTGIETELLMRRSSSVSMGFASFLVLVGNTAPTPI